MNRSGIIFLAMALFASLPLSAQLTEGKDAVVFNDYEQVLRANFWQDGSNPVGIRQDMSEKSASYAELYGDITSGGFRQTHEAALPWSVGAEARSTMHLDKFSMQGSFSFEQTQGNDMCGSMFVNPGYYPVDALEFTPGKKIRQSYAFDGSISVDVAEQWRLGAGIDFLSSNYAKRKDLRHSNYLLDFSFTPGIVWHSERWSVGLDAIIRKTADTPTAKQIGTKDTYDAFLDKGLYYGKLENWEGSGLHLSEAGVSGLPVKEIFAGAGLQLQHGSTFIDFTYLRGQGTIGEKQYIWYRFPSHVFSFSFGERWKGGDYTHSLRFKADWRLLKNNEYVIEKITEGGVSTTITHGSNQILSRNEDSFRVEYELASERHELVISGGADERLSVASQMYPYVTEQDLVQWTAAAGYTHHFGRVDISAGIRYRGGKLQEDDRLVSEESGVVTKPSRLEDYYKAEVEYDTAHRIEAVASVTYNMWKGLYLKAVIDEVHAFRIEVLPGADRLSASLRIGYKF